jgi:hypothetical protein
MSSLSQLGEFMYDKEIELGTGLNNGYRYFLDKHHPLAYDGTGLVLYHRHVASIQSGRWITSNEHVHHIDGNRLNNASDNLQIVSPAEHARLHKNSTDTIELTCIHCKKLFTVTRSKDQQKTCSNQCRSGSQVRNKTITKELLDCLIPLHSWASLGVMFGYTDNGIKKRAKSLGCDISKAKYKAIRNKYVTVE